MSLLNGRVAIVSGAGSGLGRAASLSFAKEGAEVVLLGRRLNKLQETFEAIKEATGREALVIPTDVTDEQQIKQAVILAVGKWGKIDILLNNAAVLESGHVIELTSENWHTQVATNLTGPFYLSRAVIPYMRAERYGRIINITSGLSWNGAGGYGAYSAAKAGLESLTRTLADEEHEYGILINLYNPGTLRTEMHATGKDPAVVTPDLLRLASLPRGGPTGSTVSYG
ncbi:short-chain dehydrogenase [Paenibacillus sp. BIHB 4019]|uniref:Short-chain dehydrogenase n=1 Tax=Paenibacillus sp. BIHB 4019 TaxID=1870819 RepID=A0A1B2DKI1_9BACL|nr:MULTISPECIES: SDR family oxidoreductase [unclassified Paenibacillus]ANY68191.1 short-chain dehydrogenase [Paenibacillus sp. BIHB 4019]KQO14654.1 short-chain dehydrogenase [Paenibacillus sp. Leaf72]